MRMQNSVLNISKEQVEKAIEILNPCMNDYIYVFDLKEDYYIISEHAMDRFLLPSDKFYDATKSIRSLCIHMILPGLQKK